MNSVLYARSEPVVLRMACPHCRMVTRYDVDFVAEAIKESKPIICVACEERFEIVLQKINAAEQSVHPTRVGVGAL